jgi:hypothetical protein
VFFSHNKPANSAFSTINQRNEQALLRIVAQGFHEPNDGIDEKRTLNDGIDEIIPKNRQT